MVSRLGTVVVGIMVKTKLVDSSIIEEVVEATKPEASTADVVEIVEANLVISI